MSGMAEVLACHDDWGTTRGYVHCAGCDWSQGISDTDDADEVFHAHQAAMLTAAGFGPVAEAKAEALEEAAQDFEDNIGVCEFDELARRDGAHWTHIADAWEYQGPYMDWLRNRAAELRKP
jgi:2C-methyl-D-erythritol 2,4-cyclodiphosphate synthase